MAAIDDVKSAWIAQIAKIREPIIKAEATYILDNYIAALPKQAALEANEIVSYSIGGRSFTRRDIGTGQNAIQRLKGDLWRTCFGGTSLVDANTGSTDNTE